MTTTALVLGCVGLLALFGEPRSAGHAVSAGYATAGLDVQDPEIIMRRTLTQVGGVAAVQARRSLGLLYEKQWRLVAAQEELEAALDGPDKAGVHLDLARVALKRGDPATAERHAAHGGPACAAWRLRGDAAKQLGRYAQARVCYGKARQAAEDKDDLARIDAAECDLLQLQRQLSPARQLCERALSQQPIGHPERPATLRVLGLIYYFGSEAARARGLHDRASEGFRALGMKVEANWLREYAIDDEAAELEDHAALAQLSSEMTGLLQLLNAGDETIWWRVSDAQLRLADLLRKQHQPALAAAAVAAGQAAFERRPDGWEKIPDYATVFELASLVAKENGQLGEAKRHLVKSMEVLESLIGSTVDVTYLQEEIADLDKEIAAQSKDLDVTNL